MFLLRTSLLHEQLNMEEIIVLNIVLEQNVASITSQFKGNRK